MAFPEEISMARSLTTTRSSISPNETLRTMEPREVHPRPGAPAPHGQHPPTGKLLLSFACVYLIWGSTYLAIRYAVETIPPFLMMAMRHLAAGSILYAWARLRGAPALSLRDWKVPAAIGAILFVGGHGSLAWAEQRVPSGIAALLVAVQPMFIVMLARASGAETKFSARSIAGLVLGFAGVAVLFGPDVLNHSGELNLAGAAAVLAGTFLWAVGTIWMRNAAMPASSMQSSAMQMLAGGASLAIVSGLTGEATHLHLAAVSARSWLALAYLCIFGSLVAFTAYTWLHTVEKPSRVSTYAYVNPIVAVLIGWALAGEPMTSFTIAALVIILAGVALVNTGTRQEHAGERLRPREEASAAAD
jgi:drug/metabolite transporter (DMT)-like permease